MPDIQRLKVLRPGLELGTAKKDRFEPAHALALWLRECLGEESFAPDSPEECKLIPDNSSQGEDFLGQI